MTYYQKEILKIQSKIYSNQGQITTVKGTRNYINHNYDKELNLELLSHLFFTSKFHLLRLYKRYYGQTPKQYLTERRMEKAKTFLSEGLTITDTCFDVGFESPSSFSTLFRSRNGISPTDFQKRATFTKPL